MRLWRFDGRGGLLVAAGPEPGWAPAVPTGPGAVATPTGTVWLAPVPDVEGFWLEVGAESDGVGGAPADEDELERATERVLPLLGQLLGAERDRAFVAEELASRYEEIDLLYAISEILGQTLRLEEAAQTIVREIGAVVGARRASIMVYDEATATLRTVASRGSPDDRWEPVRVDDPASIAARVYRERRVVVHDPADPSATTPGCRSERPYLGEAFLSVPICYAAPGQATKCVGVINLTDRIGGDRFSVGDRKLVAAVANQIGAAIENARLVVRDLRQQRLRRELELAHDLQLKLLPRPSVLGGDAEVAARCIPAEAVGGDFYTFTRLGRKRVGVMLGDVASHGFSAALIMALVMSAAGIHAAASVTPDETLTALLESLGTELATTEMYFSVFYGVLDPYAGRLSYANAGHPYAFRIPREGEPERLVATAPPLGLSTAPIQQRQLDWCVDTDLLVLWTDGLNDCRNAQGVPFGEQRILDEVCARRFDTPQRIVEEVLDEVHRWCQAPVDDRTLLILRL
ncbi:MAG TPA: SpoIIE family protein phosphatase [Gemmatimonadales bacterium]|nr:SpoIIE family protein phosphatase [Gemmatimonadales bacterium]